MLEDLFLVHEDLCELKKFLLFLKNFLLITLWKKIVYLKQRCYNFLLVHTISFKFGYIIFLFSTLSIIVQELILIFLPNIYLLVFLVITIHQVCHYHLNLVLVLRSPLFQFLLILYFCCQLSFFYLKFFDNTILQVKH